MAEELDAGKIVAKIVIEVETKQAEEQVNKTAENIKSALTSIGISEPKIKIETQQAEQQVKNSTKNIKTEIKSVENTNAQVNVDTKQAEEQVKGSAENIKSEIKSVENTEVKVNVDTKQAEEQVEKSTEKMINTVTEVKSVPFDWDKNEREIKKRTAEVEAETAKIQAKMQIKVPITIEDSSLEDTTYGLEKYLSRIGVKAEDVQKIMNNCFGDLSVYSQYEKQLNIIASKLGIQEKKVNDLNKSYEQYKSSGNQSGAGDKIAAQLERESLKLSQLENQYNKALMAHNNYVNSKVATYQKGVVAAENATAKEVAAQQKMQASLDRSNTALVFADLTTSLRTFNAISPGVVYNIGTIVRQLNLLRRASQANASIGMIAATSILSVVGILSTLVINCYNKIKEKQEEARKKAVESAEAYSENANTVKELAAEYINLKSKMDNSAMSSSEQQEAQEKLLSTQNQLISAYGGEAEALDLVNGKIDEQIKKINELNKEQAQKYINENINRYESALKELRKETKYEVGVIDPKTEAEAYAVVDRLKERFKSFELTDGRLTLTIDAKNAKDELHDFIDYATALKDDNTISPEFLSNIKHTAAKALNSVESETINEYKDIVEQYENALDIVNEKSDEASAEQLKVWQKIYDTLNENISVIESMSSAYETLSSGKELDASKLLELCDTYPKLAKYIAETGDLSLENGEKIKQAQQEILKSNISQLEQEKSILTFKENKNADEEKLLSRITASLSVYRQQLNDINNTDVKTPKLDISDFKTEVDSLSSAYVTLKDNKELDLSTTLDLIEKYPEFAEMMNKGSNSVEGQREAVEKLFEAKKREMLASLKADEQELQSLITTNNTEIQSLKEKMETYNMVSSVVTECKLKIGELEGKSKDYSNQLNQVKSQISAINDLNIESSSTSATNEKLQEQLKLIEHRRALNNLSYAEEISWLQMLYKEYAETAEERMQLEEKIYTAQQNAIKEQEQAYSDLYNTQISNLEHLKNLDQLSKEQELAWLNTLYSQYVLTAEERMSLEEKIYGVQKEIQEEQEQAIKDAMQSELALLEHEKNMDRLSAEDEIAWLERINQSYEMSSEDRMSIEEKIYNAKKSYEEEIQKLQQETLDKKIEALEKARNRSKITYEEELRQLREIYHTQKLTLEQQEQLLEQIRSLQQSAKSDRSSQFSNVGEGVVEALKNKYQEQRDTEEKIINDSIEGWKKWEDETVSAIQSQIDALDELANAQESEDKRREYENKREATELLLKYEKDDYNRQQYIKELNRLDNEEAERLAEEQREQQKKALQEQIETVKNQSQTQQDLLNAELETISKNYEKVMSSYSLEDEAYRMMLSKNQNEIINFIASYAPEYELAGQTLGEKLYQGLKSKIQNIDYYFQQLDVKWQWYSNQTARVANEAVDQFWASRAEYERNLNSMATIPNVNLTVNFNEQVESPVQVAHKMEEVTNNLVNQLKK